MSKISKEKLFQLYITENKTAGEIAKIFKVSKRLIFYKLNEFDISKKKKVQKPLKQKIKQKDKKEDIYFNLSFSSLVKMLFKKEKKEVE